jgi:hypothetical protein
MYNSNNNNNNNNNNLKISVSHGGEYEDEVLGYCAVALKLTGVSETITAFVIRGKIHLKHL